MLRIENVLASWRELWARPDPYKLIGATSTSIASDESRSDTELSSPAAGQPSSFIALRYFLSGFILAVTLAASISSAITIETPARSSCLEECSANETLKAIMGVSSHNFTCEHDCRPQSTSEGPAVIGYTKNATQGSRFTATRATFQLPLHFESARQAEALPIVRDIRYVVTSAWVSMDASQVFTRRGDSAARGQAFLQTGVDVILANATSGSLAFRSWYRWWPLDDGRRRSLGVRMEPGDRVAIEAVAFNSTSARVAVRNESRQQRTELLLDMYAMQSSAPEVQAYLKGDAAGWFVGTPNPWPTSDVEYNDDDYTADVISQSFSGSLQVTLEDCVAYTTAGDMLVAVPGDLINLGYPSINAAGNDGTLKISHF